ncbi:NifU family protein [Ectothiorhodospiraceae bacterium 2226]|nr:NifU family protein [Ectothiorhodospiraceae bacterium 2226]
MSAAGAGDHPVEPIRFYTEEELDAIEETDPDRAYRIARTQALAARGGVERNPEQHPLPEPQQVREALDDVRQILMQDGGDIELVAVEGREVRVRMKGACTGCPNAPLDLKNVVERVLFNAVPGIAKISNTF